MDSGRRPRQSRSTDQESAPSQKAEQKENKLQKSREYSRKYMKRKKEASQAMNQSSTSTGIGNALTKSVITPRRLTFTDSIEQPHASMPTMLPPSGNVMQVTGSHSTSHQKATTSFHMQNACKNGNTPNLSTPASTGVSAPLGDITNLNANDLQRKRKREQYTSLTAKQKENKLQKSREYSREYRKRKKEASQAMNQSSTSTGTGNSSMDISFFKEEMKTIRSF